MGCWTCEAVCMAGKGWSGWVGSGVCGCVADGRRAARHAPAPPFRSSSLAPYRCPDVQPTCLLLLLPADVPVRWAVAGAGKRRGGRGSCITCATPPPVMPWRRCCSVLALHARTGRVGGGEGMLAVGAGCLGFVLLSGQVLAIEECSPPPSPPPMPCHATPHSAPHIQQKRLPSWPACLAAWLPASLAVLGGQTPTHTLNPHPPPPATLQCCLPGF